MDNEFKLKNGSGCLCCKGCGRQDKQLNTYDWLADIPGNTEEQEMVEVQFKNTRKGYYKNSNKLKLGKGDIVAVEASPGHDIGTVTLTGRLVPLQMRKANIKPDAEIKRIYRKAKPVDMEKYEEAKAKEHDTMIRSKTETIIPIKNGCCSVPQLINAPSAVINSEIGGPTKRPTADPAVIVTIGVTKISTFAFPETRCPNSIPT